MQLKSKSNYKFTKQMEYFQSLQLVLELFFFFTKNKISNRQIRTYSDFWEGVIKKVNFFLNIYK
jgi:hypothetical protein